MFSTLWGGRQSTAGKNKPNYSKIRNLEIELGFEPYPELPPGAQLYGTSSAPNLHAVDAILKEMYTREN